MLWGAGQNGKDMAKLLLAKNDTFHWVCDNPRKIGKHVYGVMMESFNAIPDVNNPQVMIVVTSPKDKKIIKQTLENWGKLPVQDYWFFI